METQNEKPKNEKPKNEKPISTLSFIIKGKWQKGQEVITITQKPEGGRFRSVGHGYLDVDGENKLILHAQDAKGNELFPPTRNDFEFRKEAMAREQELIQRFETLEQEKNPVHQNAQSEKQPEQVQQPANTPEQPKQSVKQKNNSRKNQLSEIRNEKDADEKEQTISR